jgi:hypothetical protein
MLDWLSFTVHWVVFRLMMWTNLQTLLLVGKNWRQDVFLINWLVFNTTFNNISVISWLSVLLVEETGVPGENYRPGASHWQILSHNVVSSTPHLSGIRTLNELVLVVVNPTIIRSWLRRPLTFELATNDQT